MIKNSKISEYLSVFINPKDPDGAKGRRCILGSCLFISLVNVLSSGVFYSAFLLENDVDITGISILGFIPYVAALFSLFSPSILSHFPKRKWVLFGARIFSYFLMIGGITVLPYLINDSRGKVVGFCLIVFTAKVIDALFNPGYSIWNSFFLTPEVRAPFFAVYLAVVNIFSFAAAILASLLSDSLKGTPQYLPALLIIRIVALFIALLDCLVLVLPKEYEYPKSEKKTKLLDVFRIPLKNRRFRITVELMMAYYIITYLNEGLSTAYFLTEIGVSTLSINVVNFFYGVVLVVASSFWQFMVKKLGWLKTMGTGLLLSAPIYFAFCFLTRSNAWLLFPLLRILEHFPSSGKNLAVSNFLYLNTPEKDADNFFSLYPVLNNFAIFVGSMLGTLLVSTIGKTGLTIGNITANYGQVSYFLLAAGFVPLGIIYIKVAKNIDPSCKGSGFFTAKKDND